MTGKTTKTARRFARQPKTDGEPNTTAPSAPSAAAPTSAPAEKRPSKTDTIVALLKRSEGATITELVETTGWQPHTTRAALTGLKKKGNVITKGKRGEVTCYFIAGPAT